MLHFPKGCPPRRARRPAALRLPSAPRAALFFCAALAAAALPAAPALEAALFVVVTAYDAAGDGRTPVARAYAGGWPLEAPRDFALDVELPATAASPHSWWRARVAIGPGGAPGG